MRSILHTIFADAATEVDPGFLILVLLALVAISVLLLVLIFYRRRGDHLYRDHLRRKMRELRKRITRRR